MIQASQLPPARPRARYHQAPAVQHVPASQSLVWLSAGWRMFASHPGKWLALGLSCFVILLATSMAGSLIPVIGPVLPLIVLSLLVGGLSQVAHVQRENGDFRLIQALDGIRQHAAKLTLIGCLYAIPPIITYLLLIMLAIGGGLLVSIVGIEMGESLMQMLDVLTSLAVAGGIIALLYAFLLSAFLFAPSLVMLGGMSSWDAMRLSLEASLRNLSAVLLFALVLLILICVPVILPALEWQLPIFGDSLYIKLLTAFLTFLLGIGIYIAVVMGAIHAAAIDLFRFAQPSAIGDAA